MQEEMMQGLIGEAISMMLHYQDKNLKRKLKDGVKKLAGGYVQPRDDIFWPTGLLANTLSRLAADRERTDLNAEQRRHILEALERYFDRWIDGGMPLYVIDDVLSGSALLDLYELTGNQQYLDGARQMAEYLYRTAADSSDKKGSLPYRPNQKNHHIYADGVGMTASFLLRYGKVCQEERATWMGVVQLENMLEYGMCAKSGLPYHGYQYESGKKYGIIGWGRAVGWLFLGLAAAVELLPKNHHSYRELVYQYCQLLESVLSCQQEDGYFTWQLGADDGPVDTSATAMIGTGIAAGLRSGVLLGSEDTCSAAVNKAAKAVSNSIKDHKIYDCSGECGGFGIYPQIYGAYPWSQGPGLELLLTAQL